MILLSPIQHVADFLLTLEDFDFDIMLEINDKLRKKVKTSSRRYLGY